MNPDPIGQDVAIWRWERPGEVPDPDVGGRCVGYPTQPEAAVTLGSPA